MNKTIKNRYEKHSNGDNSSEYSEKNEELSMDTFRTMGKERVREDGRTEIII